MSETCIRTVIKGVPIDQVAGRRDEYLADCFSQEERRYLCRRHIRSTAGWLALKKAIAELGGKGSDEVDFKEDIILQCLENGRPRVRQAFSDWHHTQELFVSISHSRTMAYGLASVQEC